ARTHLMRMPALRYLDMREQARMARIGHVKNACAVRGLHVADIEGRALDPDLPAAGTVDVRYKCGIHLLRHYALHMQAGLCGHVGIEVGRKSCDPTTTIYNDSHCPSHARGVLR